MEDENSLNLSLGLPCGRGAGSQLQKGKTGNDFTNFSDGGKRKADCLRNNGNFFSDLSNPACQSEATKRSNNGGFWAANASRSIEVGERGTTEASDSHKRKRDKTMTSHISINTDDDSTGDNEDVADSEAESNGHNKDDNGSTESQGQRRFTISSEKDAKFGNMSYVSHFSQPANIANMTYSLPLKDSSKPSGTGGVPSYPGAHPLVPPSMPMMFGYSHVQRQQIQPPDARGSFNSDVRSDSLKKTQATSMPVVAQNSSGNGKHPTLEASPTEITRGNNNNNITTTADGLPCELPSIKPGLAADVKFGGCGSYPNLPWVSTTGLGPNGKTISGVTYRYSPTQIKIVCACHGSHMSPEEFIRHAGEERTTTGQEAAGGGTGVVSSFPNSNSAASAQS